MGTNEAVARMEVWRTGGVTSIIAVDPGNSVRVHYDDWARMVRKEGWKFSQSISRGDVMTLLDEMYPEPTDDDEYEDEDD